MGIVIKNFSYAHTDHTILFQDLNLIINTGEKVNLIGANGMGKSTLLNILAQASSTPIPSIHIEENVYYLPQLNKQKTASQSVEIAMGIAQKRKALQNILNGSVNEQDYTDLNDDWTIEERTTEALHYWDIAQFDLSTPMHSLSGGQQTRVYFATIMLQQPDIVLLDEPTNHIDQETREKFYHFISTYKGTVIVVSHDIELLNKQEITYEISGKKATRYTGNYDSYKQQKEVHIQSLQTKIDNLNKDIKQVKIEQQKLKQKQIKAVAQNKKAEQKAGLPKIMINAFKNAAENSSAKATEVQNSRQQKAQEELRDVRLQVEQLKPFNLSFHNTSLHNNKVLWELQEVNFAYTEQQNIWSVNLNLEIRSGERLIIKGKNGSGKSTLLNLLTGKLQPTIGQIQQHSNRVIYLDQFYSLLQQDFTLLDQIKEYNSLALTEVELKNLLFQYGLPTHLWDKQVNCLSGGECLRLAICCINLSQPQIDALLLDEPTNNLDIYGIESLFKAISQYNGTIILISHDSELQKHLGESRVIEL